MESSKIHPTFPNRFHPPLDCGRHAREIWHQDATLYNCKDDAPALARN